jgi:hypothetical protein
VLGDREAVEAETEITLGVSWEPLSQEKQAFTFEWGAGVLMGVRAAGPPRLGLSRGAAGPQLLAEQSLRQPCGSFFTCVSLNFHHQLDLIMSGFLRPKEDWLLRAFISHLPENLSFYHIF